jgi:hypothetical protein
MDHIFIVVAARIICFGMAAHNIPDPDNRHPLPILVEQLRFECETGEKRCVLT